MKRLAKIVFILYIALIITATFSSCAKRGEPEQMEKDLTNWYPKTNAPASVLYVYNASGATKQELETAVSLQGIVAQKAPAIYINYCSDSEYWLEICKKNHDFNVVEVDDLWSLVSAFSEYINQSKYVLYQSTYDEGAKQFKQTINYAAVVSAVDNYIMVSKDLQEEALAHGLTLGKDVSTEDYDLGRIFNEYKDELNKGVIIQQNPTDYRLRDYGIAVKAMCYYPDFGDGSRKIRETVLEWADQNAVVLGWTEDELRFVRIDSVFGKMSLAADHMENMSYLASLPAKESYAGNNTPRNITAQNGKHYLAIVMSDGDNIQLLQHEFSFDRRYYASPYRGNFPITWTLAPSIYSLAPDMLDGIYSVSTKNDEFIAGPSGAGYVNLSIYDPDAISEYAKITAAYMEKTGMKYINCIDNDSPCPEALAEFAKYDSVKGGVMSVGDMYLEGAGGVYWRNDKPFICIRDALWNITGAESNAYYGYTERVAQRINSYSTDPTTIEGYTVLIAHIWSVGSMDYVNKFVSELDEHVELVTVGELMDLVSKNVPHVDKAKLDDISPEDIKDLVPLG